MTHDFAFLSTKIKSSLLAAIFSSCKSESQPFFLIAFAWFTQLLVGDFKDSIFFPLLHHLLPVSSNRLTITIKRVTSKETFYNNLIHALRPLCSDSSRMTTGSPLSNQGTSAERRAFPYKSSPIYAVIFGSLN